MNLWGYFVSQTKFLREYYQVTIRRDKSSPSISEFKCEILSFQWLKFYFYVHLSYTNNLKTPLEQQQLFCSGILKTQVFSMDFGRREKWTKTRLN